MKRLATMAACLGLFPASAVAQELLPSPTPAVPVPAEQPVAPAEPAPPTPAAAPALPGTTVPIQQFSPALYPPLTPSPAVQYISPDDYGRVVCCTGGPRSGIAASLNPLNWLRSRGCDDGCGKVRPGLCGREGRPCWERLGQWISYHPDYTNKMMPCFRPSPYQAPLYTYFQCKEPGMPTVAPACGPAGCANGKCHPWHTRKSSIASLFESFLPRSSVVVQGPVEVQPPPGVRYANPTPAPQPGAAGQSVTPVSYTTTKPWPAAAAPRTPPPPVTRPFTNP